MDTYNLYYMYKLVSTQQITS